MNLSSTIKSIQDIMRKDDGVDGDAQRIGQLTWMLFLKIFDQCEETWEDDAADHRKKYLSPIPEGARWRDWAKSLTDAEGKTQPRFPAGELIKHVNDVVFPELQNLDIAAYADRCVALEIEAKKGPELSDPAKARIRATAAARARVVRGVFEDTNNYMKSGTQMLAVIGKLDEAIDFHDLKSRGQMGAIYEQILNDLRSAGNAGEFYTPRAVTEFMVAWSIPDGTLFGEGVKAKVKELLMEHCHLHTIIRLPNGVFAPYTGIKTNLLFFTKGRPTSDIWFYEHRYPAGVKSYSKTKPLRVEEFDPVAAWWGTEADGFAARRESEVAWKVDFAALKAAALAKAEPHRQKAETLRNQAAALVEQIKELRDSIKGEKADKARRPVEAKIDTLNEQIEALREQAKAQDAIADRHYWPIYNLDVRAFQMEL